MCKTDMRPAPWSSTRWAGLSKLKETLGIQQASAPTDVFAQAQVLDFYDPDRAWAITAHGSPSDQSRLETVLTAQRATIAERRGNGFYILTGAITSPTLAGQLDALLARYPEARCCQWQPISRENVSTGAVIAYGEPVELAPKLDAADVIFAIDSDLLSSAPWSLFYGERASANPWDATGLEWQTSSPPLTENFVSTPTVTEPPYNYPPPEVLQRHV